MKKQKNIFIGLSLLILAGMACNAILPKSEPTAQPLLPTQSLVFTVAPLPTQSGLPLSEAEVPRVTAEEAKAALDGGKAVIVDVRSAEAFLEAHIAGAISIPLSEFENNIANVSLDRNQWIITYCT